MHDPWSVLGKLLLAALLGVVGQFIRVIVGLKKEYDSAAAAKTSLWANFNGRELFVSLGIAVAVGSVAGVLSAMTTVDITTSKAMVALMGAGYSGTDFIEGFMKTALP
jgi:hypothetical protein